VGSGN